MKFPRRWTLNPVARKRWRRFRANKRAFRSLVLLGGLYLLSLGAELICNNRPLLVIQEGRMYFPFLVYYPDDTFTGSGLQTRPDYKAIARSERFAEGSGNHMVFALFPYGPYEILDPDSLRDEESVTVKLRPRPRVASISVDREGRITRALAAESFFPGQEGVTGSKLSIFWPVNEAFRDAMEARFENREAGEIRMELNHAANPSLSAELSMSRFRPRSRPPEDVRITFREQVDVGRAYSIVFNHALETIDGGDGFAKLPAKVQAQVRQLAETRFREPLFSPDPIEIAGVSHDVEADLNDIQWPYPPVGKHWMGIDSAGRDVFARILYGLRISMTFGLLLVSVTMLLGTLIGAIQGYYGGRTDMLGQRLIEIWSAVPFLYVMILIGSVYGRGFGILLFCYGLFNWIGISYYMRAEFLRLRHRPFVESARCLGIPAHKIMLRHILPNALAPIITFFPFSLVGAIDALAVLDYLGFGLPPPTPSWGELLHQAQSFRWAWWLILYPTAALFVVMLLGVFIGEGVRDANDPKPFSRMVG